MGAPHAAGRGCRPAQRGSPAVDRKLRLVVENDKHLFHLVVIVVADAAFGRENAAVHEYQIGVEALGIHQRLKPHLARPAVDRAQHGKPGGIRMSDARPQRLPRSRGNNHTYCQNQ